MRVDPKEIPSYRRSHSIRYRSLLRFRENVRDTIYGSRPHLFGGKGQSGVRLGDRRIGLGLFRRIPHVGLHVDHYTCNAFTSALRDAGITVRFDARFSELSD